MPSLEQMQAMLKLANALHAAGGPGRRVERLLGGLLSLLEADAAVSAWVPASPAAPLRHVVTAGPGMRDRAVSAFVAALPGATPLRDFLRTRPAANAPAVRHDADLPPITDVPEPARPHAIYSLCRSEENTDAELSLLVMLRKRVGRHRFNERDATILRLVHPQTVWAVAAPENDQPVLPRRANDVLNLLLAGHSEKEIARRVGRSTHTVHTHIKRVYRHFGVGTRAELLARFVR